MDGLAEGTLVSAYVLTTLSYLVIIIRLFLRFHRHEKITVDDCLMIVALVFLTVFTATYPNTVKNGTNFSFPDFSKLSLTSRTNNGTYTNGTEVSGGGNSSNLSPDFVARVELGSKWVLYGRPFYLVYLWAMKYCLLIFLHRTTSESKEKIAIIVTSVLLVVTFVVSLLATVLVCDPIQLAWQVVPEVPDCAQAFASTLVVGSSDILTDLVLMAIPIPVIIRRRLPPQKIYDVSVLYAVAVLIIICVLVRMVIVLGNLENFQQRQLILAQVECFLVALVVNTPVIRRLLKHDYDHVSRRQAGSDDCSVADAEAEPGISLSIIPPPQGTDNVPHGLEPPQPTRSGLRASIDYVREKLGLGGPVKIERDVQLLQERKTGQMPVTPAAKAAVDFFAEIPTHQTLAHISTEISSTGSVESEASHRRRVREKMKAASSRLKVHENPESYH